MNLTGKGGVKLPGDIHFKFHVLLLILMLTADMLPHHAVLALLLIVAEMLGPP